ncbi:MAG: pyridoxal-phosphate dependent enzyme, partial [Planctomycetota bacterium]
ATDAEIVDAIKLLGRTEGIFTEPAGGTTLACAAKLIQNGTINKDESIVVCVTGNGLKTIEAVADELDRPAAIDAKLAAFDDYVDRHGSPTPSTAPTNHTPHDVSNTVETLASV